MYIIISISVVYKTDYTTMTICCTLVINCILFALNIEVMVEIISE